MAAELEERLAEETELVKSSGGIFEVEDRGELIFSKRELKRFPEGEEIFEIIQMVDSGEPLDKARKKARESISEPISFGQWLQSLLKGRTSN